LPACPECGSARSFAIAGTVTVKRAATARVTAAAPGGTSRIPAPSTGGTSRITAAMPIPVAAAAPAAATGSYAIPTSLPPFVPPAPLPDDDWWDSGIHRAALALVVISGAYLVGCFFLAGGTLSIGRAVILVLAGIWCFWHSEWGIHTAKVGCYFSILVDLRSAYFQTIILGFDRYALTELVHVAVISVCLYLLFHDGFPNLKNWYRALLATVVVYLLMLVVCGMGVHREIDEDRRKAQDEMALQALKGGAKPANVFLAEEEHVLAGLTHTASLALMNDLQRAGVVMGDLKVASLAENEAHTLVITLPVQPDRRAAVLKRINQQRQVKDDEADPDVGAAYATLEFWGRMRRDEAEFDEKP
jgi:hypothetical protein